MDFFTSLGVGLGVFLAAILGALFRVFKVDSKAQTFWGKFFDRFLTIILSVSAALLFLNPFMAFFSIPLLYAPVCSAFLALTSEIFVSKILDLVRQIDLVTFFKIKLK